VIHSTAIIHPKAELDSSVRVGPYAVIDEGVRIGPQCVVGPHTYLTGLTTIGEQNLFFAGCVIGEAPQDLKYRGEPTGLKIGDRNRFREHVTVHRSCNPSEATTVGSDNLFMGNVHIAHDCIVSNHVIMANGSMLGGHVLIGDRAIISGNCLVHQFVRVGTLAMMQGGSAISQDLPPFTVARGHNGLCGLNVIGLRRAGFSDVERLEIKRLYHALFRSGTPLRDAVAEARKTFSGPPAIAMLDFIASSQRGICARRRGSEDDE
jgi:UDP-N-acetylglucosamine acyltransferase